MSQAYAAALHQAFLDARTQNAWQPKDVPDSLLRQLVDTVKMGPTSANCQPARFVFVKSKEVKEKLKPFLSEGNRDKTMQAPCAPSSAMTSNSIPSVLKPRSPRLSFDEMAKII